MLSPYSSLQPFMDVKGEITCSRKLYEENVFTSDGESTRTKKLGRILHPKCFKIGTSATM